METGSPCEPNVFVVFTGKRDISDVAGSGFLELRDLSCEILVTQLRHIAKDFPPYNI